ncbi:MAG: NADPH:quinone reductase [Geobacteraceae bacterium GWC2_48_7]|nr:MAG: NADPH:quinone reductase [Geobacteraceae bacterium GWC2_48_7]
MRAVVIDQYGGPDVLELRDMPLPEIRNNDLLVEVHSASVNPVDWKIRSGYLEERLKYKFPLILGWDVAGVVVDTGAGVKNYKKGDMVFSRTDISRNGTYAEYVAVDETYVAGLPQNLSFQEAASIPLVGLTAWQALVDYAEIKKGDKVLIHAGAGGVGAFAIQLAKSKGCYVATTCSSNHVDLVNKLGADHIVDYTKSDFTLELHDFDVVFDTIGGDTYRKSFKVLRQQQGVMISILEQPDHEMAHQTGARVGYLFMQPDGKELAQIGQMLENGEIKPVVGKIFPLEDIKKAHELSESHHATGKIVLHIE